MSKRNSFLILIVILSWLGTGTQTIARDIPRILVAEDKKDNKHGGAS